MSQIGLNISVSGLTGKLLIRWVKASAPLAEVGRSDAFDFPYDDVYVITDLTPVVYIVQLWRSDDGISLDQLIKDWSIDASKETQTTITTYQYKVDRGETEGTPGDGTYWADPENLDINLVDERLDGFSQDQLIVHEAGYGNRLNSEYELLAGGGITLLNDYTFNSDTAWFITTIQTTEVTIPASESSSQLFADVEEITEDIDFYTDPTDNLYNKLCPINSVNPTVQVTFPDLALIPDGTYVTFNTHFGSQNYLILQFDAGDTVRSMNDNKNVVYIPKNQVVSLFFFGGVCYITSPTEYLLRRGTVLQDYDVNRSDTLSVIAADEATGELSRDDYPGLYEFISNLSGDAVCPLGSSSGQWSYSNAGVFENKRKFGIDTVAFTFRVPHLTGVSPKYGTTPGVYEADQVGEIAFDFDYKQGKSDDNESGVSGEYLRKPGASGGTNYGNTTVAYSINAGNENKIKAVLQKAWVVL